MMPLGNFLLLALLLAPSAAMAERTGRVASREARPIILRSGAAVTPEAGPIAKLEGQKKPLEIEKRDLGKHKAEFDRQANALRDDAREVRRIQDLIQNLQKSFDRSMEDTFRQLNEHHTKLLEPVIKTARAELDKRMVEKGQNAVIEIPLYASPTLVDITAELARRIDAAIIRDALNTLPEPFATVVPGPR